MEVIEPIRSKLARAKEHLSQFEEEAGAYFAATKSVLEILADPARRKMFLRLDSPDEPPLRLAIIAGDCVHNARSALDNIICALVRAADPKSDCRGMQYPAFTDRANYLKQRDKVLMGVPEKARAIIDELQPCAVAGAAHPPKMHAVAILNKLSNLDKHRSPHLISAYSRKTRIAVGSEGRYLEFDGPLYANTTMEIPYFEELIRASPTESNSTLNIMFADRSLFGDEPVLSLLTFSVDFVRDVVLKRLEPFLDPR